MWRSVLLAGLLGSCVGFPGEPRNPHTVEAAWGLASAREAEVATRISVAVERTLEAYRDLPGYVAVDRLRVHGVADLEVRGSEVSGLFLSKPGDQYILVEDDDPRKLEHTIAHEVAHATFPGLSRLPQIVEEGVCHLLAETVMGPEERDALRAQTTLAFVDRVRIHAETRGWREGLLQLLDVRVPPLEVALEVDQPFASEWSPGPLYGLGELLARRIGLGPLLQITADATNEEPIPPVAVLALAGLDSPDRAELDELVREVWWSGSEEPLVIRLEPNGPSSPDAP